MKYLDDQTTEKTKIDRINYGIKLNIGYFIPCKNIELAIKLGANYGVKNIGFTLNDVWHQFAHLSIGIKKK